jgi:hypothetical protein
MSPLNATTKYGVCRYNHRPYGGYDYTPKDVSCTIIIFRHWTVLDPAKGPCIFGDLDSSDDSCSFRDILLQLYGEKSNQSTILLRGECGHCRAWQNILASQNAAPGFLGHDIVLDEGDQSMAVELARRIHGQSITISEYQIRKWTPKVAKLMRIKLYRVVKLWGCFLEKVADIFRSK